MASPRRRVPDKRFGRCRYSAKPSAKQLFVWEIKGFRSGSIDSNHPQGTAQLAGAGRGASHFQPAPIFFVGLIGIHKNIPVTILSASLRHRDFLMPTMLTANWIGLHGEGQVLMHARILPMNTR